MTTATIPQIDFVAFNDLVNWSVRYLRENRSRYRNTFSLIRIGNFLKRNRNIIEIQDDVLYTRVTIRLYTKGVLKRDEEWGRSIGTKRQFVVSPGQFIMSKIDARNGAFGLVSPELDGAVTTADFLSYDVDTSRINPEFLTLVSSTKEFLKICQSSSSGTTGRQRVDETQFLNIKIPLPTLTEQDRIVAAYNARINEAQRLAKQADELEQGIETYFDNALGIKPLMAEKKLGGLQLINFSEIDRWDVWSENTKVYAALNKGYFLIIKLGQVFPITTRTWKKQEWAGETFGYIELGSVDPSIGIVSPTIIKVKDAPSRATQIVREGDLLIGTTRPYLKKFALVPKEFDNYVCSSGFAVIRPSDNYSLPYLKEFLMSYFGTEQLKIRMSGATYPAITNQELIEILIPLPPLEVQISIVEHIKAIKRHINNLVTKVNNQRQQAIEEIEAELFA